MVSSTRVVTWLVVLAIPAILWGCLTAAKNDLLVTTRSLVRQIQHAHEGVRLDDLKSQDRLASTQVRFYNRYRFPEGPPQEQEWMFDALWSVLRDCDPDTATYGESGRKALGDGRSLPLRAVMIRGQSVSGGPLRVRLDWVQYRGSWYIDSYEVLNRGRQERVLSFDAGAPSSE
jgi:hypothetical protein